MKITPIKTYFELSRVISFLREKSSNLEISDNNSKNLVFWLEELKRFSFFDFDFSAAKSVPAFEINLILEKFLGLTKPFKPA